MNHIPNSIKKMDGELFCCFSLGVTFCVDSFRLGRRSLMRKAPARPSCVHFFFLSFLCAEQLSILLAAVLQLQYFYVYSTAAISGSVAAVFSLQVGNTLMCVGMTDHRTLDETEEERK